MKAYHAIIIFGGRNDGESLHNWAKRESHDNFKILYYGLAVKGKCWDGSSASNRMVTIVEVNANGFESLKASLKYGGHDTLASQLAEMPALGKFDKNAESPWTSSRGWKKVKVNVCGKTYGVSCLYELNNKNPNEPLDTVFTYGDKRKTVKAFNNELVGEVTTKFKDLSGNGIPEEFAIQDGSIGVKMGKDGKVRLCFSVHMKSSKKDFADVKLQTKINELRKEVSTKYGVDIDIVDIRSTIEYV